MRGPAFQAQKLNGISTLVAIFCLLFTHAFAGEPGWGDVPDRLKTQAGVERKGEYLYATGEAKAEAGIRADKAHEVAKKKSLLRALQIVHLASSCQDLLERLNPDERAGFLLHFTPLASSIRIEGLTVLRQWEIDESQLTNVAVPLSTIPDVPCPFKNLEAAISGYLSSGGATLEGLEFSLAHIPRHTRLLQSAKDSAARWFRTQEYGQLALCFQPYSSGVQHRPPYESVLFQKRLEFAQKLTAKATMHSSQGNWKDAGVMAAEALGYLPNYGPAYLVLADFFLTNMNMPAFALWAAEKAMGSGVPFKDGLAKIVFYLNTLQSPEAEVYRLLLSECEEPNESDALSIWRDERPGPWKPEIRRLGEAPVRNLVVLGLGNALLGPPASPGPEFRQAVDAFEQAKGKEDLNRALDILLDLCEKQPTVAQIHNLIGACYRNLDKPSFALPFLWQALTLQPDYDLALTNLGLCCQALGLMQSARFYFEQDAVRNSQNPWVKAAYVRFNQTTR